MNNREFEQFVQENGNDILSFCKMHTMNVEYGNELYQDTMLKLLEKQEKLDSVQNVKAYALSVAIFLWKNKKKKYLKRNKIVSFRSLDEIMVNDSGGLEDSNAPSPEGNVLEEEKTAMLRSIVAELPEKLKIPILLYYSSNMKIDEIAECTGECPNTIKTRLRKAKSIIKEKLDASLEKVSNTFIVKAYAQELTSDNSIPITIGEESGNGYVMGGSEKDGHVSYCINLPLSCEGENIKNITYSINKGCFQIIEPADKTYLVDYIEHTENMEFGKCGGLGDEEVDSDLWPEEKELYLDSFTVDYNNQVGEDFWINIGNVVPNMYEIIWSEKDSIEEQAEADNMLLSDIKINVTVTFEDGTQSSKTIGLETKIVDKRPEKPCRAIEFFIKEL